MIKTSSVNVSIGGGGGGIVGEAAAARPKNLLSHTILAL
jgi:hypothetical protein